MPETCVYRLGHYLIPIGVETRRKVDASSSNTTVRFGSKAAICGRLLSTHCGSSGVLKAATHECVSTMNTRAC